MSDFKFKLHQNRSRLGLCPKPRSPGPLAGIKGSTSKRRGEIHGREREKREEKAGEGRERKKGERMGVKGPPRVSSNFPKKSLCHHQI